MEENILTINNLKKGLYIKTNALTENGIFIYLYIKDISIEEAINYYKFYFILPKQSIIFLKNNYVKEFEWEYYMKCLHRYDKKDLLDDKTNFIQRNSKVKNLKTPKHKRGKPKRRSRPIFFDFGKQYYKNKYTQQLNNINPKKWLIVNEKEYKKFCLLKKINRFIYFMHDNKFGLPNEIFYSIYNFIL